MTKPSYLFLGAEEDDTPQYFSIPELCQHLKEARPDSDKRSYALRISVGIVIMGLVLLIIWKMAMYKM